MSQPAAKASRDTVGRSAQTHAHKDGGDKFPPEATEALDQLVQLALEPFAVTLDSTTRRKALELADQTRKPMIGTRVCIDGLTSPAGQKLNGLHVEGTVVAECEAGSERLRELAARTRTSNVPT